MGQLEHVKLKTGVSVPNAVCAAAMSTLRRIREENPQFLVRIVRSGGERSLWFADEDQEYLDGLGLLERHTNSLPNDFLQVLLSAVTVEIDGPVIGNPVDK